MLIGPHRIHPNVVLAPMAGVTDKPFRLLCKRLGAGLAVSEMTTSDPRFWRTAKSVHRMDHVGEPDPISVQIAGTVPEVLAEVPRVLADPAPNVFLTAFAADGLELTFSFWIGDPENGQMSVRSAVNMTILSKLNEWGVEIPFPQRVLRRA